MEFSEKSTIKMSFSLNCLISGQTIPFVTVVGESYVDNNGYEIPFNVFTVSHFKEQLFRLDNVKAEVQNFASMDLLKVELDIKSLKDKNEDEIRNSGTIMEPTDDLADYFNPTDKNPRKKFLHVFIQPLSFITDVTKSPDRVCLFVDNSNFTKRGKYTVNCKEPRLSYKNQIIFDYGMVFKKVIGNRELGNTPLIVGSDIPPDDSIFKEGYDVKVFSTNCIGIEKGVDNFITLRMAKAFYRESPGILVLIAGDGDYFGTLLEAIEFKWKVEVWFWKSGILNSLNKHEPTKLCIHHLFPVSVSDQFKLCIPQSPIGVSGFIKSEAKIKYTQLDTFYKFFAYATGPDHNNKYNKMETLEFTSNTTIEDEKITEWLSNLDLFSWINREAEHIILYFNNKRELNIAKKWIMNEHKEISIWEKKEPRKPKRNFYNEGKRKY